ncbi:DsbA family oxidoreductase [Siphonobacter curvatus]|uniref:Disulfide bond formation protein DsbA n=1 Tax=Siphonobacter curvatus TaxID=2094562 RepID=A0A2S7ISF9_9BACT|nr:DsbA family oxidoreductase [Siphonobacter curvatus]PQA60653.1 disulfide bond formation protein DsbA [Siphonobacter curvatus]
MALPIRIDVVSDVVCPWCYIGKRRLESALAELSTEVQADVVYHPFQLDPTVPRQGKSFAEHMASKFGPGRSESMFQHVEQVASEVGLDFDFNEIPKSINTFDLHRLLTVAYEKGLQAATKEALLKAYFVDRIDLTQEAVLLNVLESAGWDKKEALEVLKSEVASDSVQSEMEYFKQLGVSGVPFFILNNKYALSGAQPKETFMQALRQVIQESQPQIIAEGDSCDTTTGEC